MGAPVENELQLRFVQEMSAHFAQTNLPIAGTTNISTGPHNTNVMNATVDGIGEITIPNDVDSSSVEDYFERDDAETGGAVN